MNSHQQNHQPTGLEIAIIGMSGRFPGAKDINQFWENLKNGVESISFFSDNELEREGINLQNVKRPDYIKARGIIEEIEYFDSNFFDYTPIEAEIMDPQVRKFHECVWEVLEDAGYNPWKYNGLIGLYAGASANKYWEGYMHFSGKSKHLGAFASTFHIDKDFLSLLISYKLNLKGPVITLYTACSTSLVAVHMASRALLTGECHIALAGGVTINTPHRGGYIYKEGMIHSPDGHCRTFDGKAAGTISGNGIGVVALKSMAAALNDGDHIYAVIKGSTVNNDGAQRLGFTVPSINGQAEAIQRTLLMSEVEPESIKYIETHGTGTPLGDPVEMEALKIAFQGIPKESCKIGSIKSNMGHLDCAAGIVGFIKTTLILKNKLIPPSLHFESPNPKIQFNETPFSVNQTITPIIDSSYPLRAGVSSFGIGGTNAHIILEEAPQKKETAARRQLSLLLLSAKSKDSLEQMKENLLIFLKKNPQFQLADIAYTLQVGRGNFSHRMKFVCASIPGAIDLLESGKNGKIQTSITNEDKKTVIFMFPGVGAQYVNMGRQLYEKEPIFRQEMDQCFETLSKLSEENFKDIIYPQSNETCTATDTTATSKNALPFEFEKINQFEIAQVVIFILEYSLAKLLMKWGIQPDAMIGYSLGEYTAACLSGVFSLEDVLKVILIRGKLIHDLPPGGMLSIPLNKSQLEPLIEEFAPGLSLAIDNGPSCVVAGVAEEINKIEEEMKKKKVLCIRLNSSFGLHSKAMEPIIPDLNQILEKISCQPPQIPYISNITGTWIKSAEVLDSNYWTHHLTNTVQFADGIGELIKQPQTIFIEVGPDRDLCSLLNNIIPQQEKIKTVNLVRNEKNNTDDQYYLLSRLGQLWLYGMEIQWQGFYHDEKRYRLSLPKYPFERHYFETNYRKIPVNTLIPAKQVTSTDSRLEKRDNIADWFYYPSWIRSPLPLNQSDNQSNPGHWLIFNSENDLCSRFIDTLNANGEKIINIIQGDSYKQLNSNTYSINPALENDYFQLLKELSNEKFPSHIIHFWSMTEISAISTEMDSNEIEKALIPGFFSLVYLGKALGKLNIVDPIKLDVITNQLQDVTGEEVIYPQNSTVLGPIKVLPQEYPFIRCRNIDVIYPQPDGSKVSRLVELLLIEVSQNSPETDIAYRNQHRWVKQFTPVPFGEIKKPIDKLRKGGVYLITGGLGKIGLTLAEYLVEDLDAKLILVGRSKLPPRDQWEQLLNLKDDSTHKALKLKKILKLESKGSQILIFNSDLSNPEELKKIITEAEEKLGPINGVIHAAGDIRESIMHPIENVTPVDCQYQFLPKILGILNLEKALRGKELDFCWLTSSLSPILGGLRLCVYSAANHFLDSYATWYQRRNSNQPITWISTNWADWNFSTGEMNIQSNTIDNVNKNDKNDWLMNPKEGVESFRRILYYCSQPRVVVSTTDLHVRIERWVTLNALRKNENISIKSTAFRERPQLETQLVKPTTIFEKAIAEVIQELLGLQEVGIHDNFFELGATSLKIIQINSLAREKLNQDIPVMWWFENPTIKLLAEFLHKKNQSNPAIGEENTKNEEKRTEAVTKGKKRLEKLRKRTNSN